MTRDELVRELMKLPADRRIDVQVTWFDSNTNSMEYDLRDISSVSYVGCIILKENND